MRALLRLALVLALASPLAQAQTNGSQPVPPVIVIPEADVAIEAGPRLEVISPASPLPAKERVNLFLEIVNLGPGDARDLSVFVQPGAGSGLVVVGQLARGLDDLPENASELLVLRVATPANAGGAPISLVLTFVGPDGQTIRRERNVVVQIKPPESAPLDVDRVDGDLVAGEEAEVTFRFRNPHPSEIRDLDVELMVERQVSPLGGGLGTTPDISPGEESSLIVQGARLAPGQTTLVEAPVLAGLRAEELVLFTLRATYTLEGFERVQEFEFGARVFGSVNLRVLDAREVDTGEGIEVAGTVVNVGSGTAWNPRVDVAEGSGLRAEAPLLIEDLEPNEAVSFRLPVERVGERTPGAPLFVLDWNDDHGNVVAPRPVTGTLREAEPLPPTRLDTFWARLASVPPAAWFLLALATAITVVALLVARRARLDAAEEEEAPATASAPATAPAAPGATRGKPEAKAGAEAGAEAEEDEYAPKREPWWKRKQGPKGRSGARPL